VLRAAALLLAAAAAGAAPEARWIDATGGLRTARVVEVLSESVARVEVRLEGGEKVELSGRGLLSLVREREGVELERALLEAREAAAWGLDLDGARATLERVLADAPAAWVREYALAARAIVAERAGEKDAAERLEAFLRDHPDSRFVPDALLARARLRSAAETDVEKAQAPFAEANREIRRLGGPWLLVQRARVEAARALLRRFPTEADFYLDAMTGALEGAADRGEEVAAKICARATKAWIELERHVADRADVVARGYPPLGPLARMEKLRDVWSFLLPELASDLRRECAETLLLCNRAAEAEAEFRAAEEAAPDRVRRALAVDGARRARDAALRLKSG
jgi:hypothetical protein